VRSAAPLALAAALLLTACAWLGRSPEIAHHAPATSAAEKAQAAGAAALRDGNYEQALDQLALSWKENPDNPAVSRDFAAALEGLKKSGDEALRQGTPDEAGKRWTAALRHVGHPATRGKALSFSRADLKSSVDHLSAALMEKGLKEYQTGNLEAAIAIWRSILAYDPANVEAAKSIKTTTTQIENLKKLPPPAK
jgi:tetratricopeptide (TPR) repeat protein